MGGGRDARWRTSPVDHVRTPHNLGKEIFIRRAFGCRDIEALLYIMKTSGRFGFEEVSHVLRHV